MEGERQILIAPSLLACDFGRVNEEVKKSLDAGADLLHLDVMDGHFVPNLSYGFPIIASLAKSFPSLRLDVHLMVSNPETYIERLAELGAYQISVHLESSLHIHRLLHSIRDRGVRAGLAFNPHTPISGLEYIEDLIDCLLIMTVNPGFGGQSFLRSQLSKIEQARLFADKQERDVYVAVDGGVDATSGPLCRQAGADFLVAGSYLYRAEDMAANIRSLRGIGV